MRDRAADESAWVSAHVFYHGDLDRPLVHAVAPLVDELAAHALAREFFFIRYWDGGLHVRLRALPATGVERAEVETLIGDRFAAYLAVDPAADLMTPEEYAEMAGSLARMEGVATHAERLHPNNSVAFIPYRREHDRYGYGGAIQAVEKHFADSSRIALRALTSGVTPERRVTAALALILLTWFVGQPDLGRLITWIGGQIEDLTDPERTGSDSAAAVASALADQQRRDQAIALAKQMRMLAIGAVRSQAGGTLVDWARSIGTLREELAVQVAAGAFIPKIPARGRRGRIATPGPEGGVAAVLDICAHMICNRLGLSVGLETAVRGLAAGAVVVLGSERN
jgi:hypothetical protein